VSARLLAAILNTIIEEGIVVAVILFGLPRLGITVPVSVLIVLLILWAVISVVLYRLVSRALRRKPAVGVETLIGGWGMVVVPLEPEGMVKLGGELWRARSEGRRIEKGEEIVVRRVKGTLLIVSPAS
jgi:membrane-bound ClpP family serine protease